MHRPDLKAIRERCDAATEGPWELKEHSCSAWRFLPDRYLVYDQFEHRIECCHEDSDFIANAREDVPLLCDAYEELEKENAKLKRIVETLKSVINYLESVMGDLNEQERKVLAALTKDTE
jgi:hypothetical protein